MEPSLWDIGPIVNGVNSSVGMPLHPMSHPEGWVIELPQPTPAAGHANYVTTRFGSLVGKTRIKMRYRIEVAEGQRIAPYKAPESPAILTLFFQRVGDNWSAQGKYETYRWWASFKSHISLITGQYEIDASLSENWTAVLTSSAQGNNAAFMDAVINAERVGFTLGGGDGLGHGIFATGPARIIVTEFELS
jgi:hypothetical protein